MPDFLSRLKAENLPWNKSHSMALQSILLISGLCIALFVSSLYSYLLFHSLTEIFSIMVAWGIFMIAWNSRRIISNNYLLFIGIAYLFIGFMDLLHTLAYKGMGVFPWEESNPAVQLWIGARFMESLSLLGAMYFIRRRVSAEAVFWSYLAITTLLVSSILVFHVFPRCYVDGKGLTDFKILSEYIICTLLGVFLFLLYKSRKEFEPGVFRLIVCATITSIGAELAFTFYVSMYGFSNLIGHYLKIASFYCVYRALIVTGFERPFAVLFHTLRESEEFNRGVIANSPDCIKIINADGYIQYISEGGVRLLGGSDESQFLAKRYLDFWPPQFQPVIMQGMETARQGKSITVDAICPTMQGEEKWWSVTLGPLVREDGSIEDILVVSRDITIMKQSQEALKESLLAKETLLKEVHHRVKNNLMVIQSLLTLQSRELSDERFKAAFSESSNRVKAMSLIHERLYRADDLKSISFKMYLRDLVVQLFKSYKLNAAKVRLEFDLDECSLDVSTIIPLGLIVNELISNACKYAFPSDQEGAITLTFKLLENDNYLLSIKDTGVGLPQDFHIEQTKSLGMQIIRTLTKQIAGKLEILQQGGTEFRITFSERLF